MHYGTPVSKHWQISPDGGSPVQGAADIDLCIRNILGTRKGTDVTRPDFGSGHFDYLDTPEDVFVPNAVREVMLAVNTWEKRAVVEKTEFSGRAPHLVMTVFWRAADDVSGEIYQTPINLERASWI